MIIEVGVHTNKCRIKLKLESEDVETHSFMTDNLGFFRQLGSSLSDRTREFIAIEFEAYTPEPEPELVVRTDDENKPEIDF